MRCRGCAFETERLLVQEWHALSSRDGQQQDLVYVVATMLTEPVTRSLPASWQGSYTVERAREWIAERDREGATLLVVDKSTCQAIGLMILFETDAENGGDGIEVRLGYLLSESAWGRINWGQSKITGQELIGVTGINWGQRKLHRQHTPV